ncbi:hypothetical protein ACSBR1_001298 [Camellia fascicularis]
MYYNGPMTFLQLKLAWVLLGAAFASAAVAQTLPGCEDRCGNISIPYPFGTTEGCYIQQHFKVACNDTDYHPPKLFLESSDTNVEITEILLSGELRISAWIGFDCFSEGGVQYQNNTFETWIRVPEFPISNTRNKFTAVGCDTYAVIKGSLGRKYATGCLSLCDTIDSVINGSCSGIGCCQTRLLIEGDRALVVRSRVGNVMDYSEFLNENDIDLAIESDLESQSFIPDETQITDETQA